MVSMRDFLSGIIAGFLHLFISPFVITLLPGFGAITYYLYNALFFGIWVVIATLILERTGH